MDIYSEKYDEILELARLNIENDRFNSLKFGQKAFELKLLDKGLENIDLHWAMPPTELFQWLSRAGLNENQIVASLTRPYSAFENTFALSNAAAWATK